MRVLVVDDHEASLEALEMTLAAAGHQVRTARDGPLALSVAADFLPDVVVLDVGLPIMDGHQVARRLRDLPDGARTVLIGVSGYAPPHHAAGSRASGFDHYLVKPVDADRLLALVDRARG